MKLIITEENEKLDYTRVEYLIRGTGIGKTDNCKNEKKWRDVLKFFIQGNETTMNKLKDYIEE